MSPGFRSPPPPQRSIILIINSGSTVPLTDSREVQRTSHLSQTKKMSCGVGYSRIVRIQSKLSVFPILWRISRKSPWQAWSRRTRSPRAFSQSRGENHTNQPRHPSPPHLCPSWPVSPQGCVVFLPLYQPQISCGRSPAFLSTKRWIDRDNPGDYRLSWVRDHTVRRRDSQHAQVLTGPAAAGFCNTSFLVLGRFLLVPTVRRHWSTRLSPLSQMKSPQTRESHLSPHCHLN